MEILILLLGIEFSGINGGNEQYNIITEDDIIVYYEQQYYATFDIGIELYEIFYAKGSAKILMYKRIDNETFSPRSLSSVFETGFIWNGFSIGYRYICIHPITPYVKRFVNTVFIDQIASEFFLRYETEIKIF